MLLNLILTTLGRKAVNQPHFIEGKTDDKIVCLCCPDYHRRRWDLNPRLPYFSYYSTGEVSKRTDPGLIGLGRNYMFCGPVEEKITRGQTGLSRNVADVLEQSRA